MNETQSEGATGKQSRNTRSWRTDRVLVALMLLATLFGLIYNGVIRLGYGPDEGRHMNYVKLLYNEHTLPYQEPDPNNIGQVKEHGDAHTFHPPLYHLLFVPFYAVLRLMPGESEWHVLRVLSLLLCVGALPLFYEVALRAGGGDRWLARLVTAQVALLPIFGMTAGIINNDSATLFAVAVFLWLLVVRYATHSSFKSAAVLGVCMGLGGLCKATALLCDGVALLAYLWIQAGRPAVRTRVMRTRLIGCVAVTLGIAFLLVLPWHLRSFNLYGTWTPLPPPMPSPALPAPSNGALVIILHENFPLHFWWANWGLFYTLWSQRDWLLQRASSSVALQPAQLAIYLLLLLYSVAALVGTLVARRKTQPSSDLELAQDVEIGAVTDSQLAQRIALWGSYGAFIATWLTVLQVALFMHWGWAEGGRYLGPGLVGFSIFLARGWRGLVGTQRLKWVFFGWSAAFVMLNLTCIGWIVFYLNPTHAPQ
ncbi:MAG TPA: glycosyltransferase family 39 protein [Abditibacteriaceae bacterium]|jgi:4-amino-4-deoxy-L-arabinose transferase-like glycosyltransferase